MILLNFSHPLTAEQLATVTTLINEPEITVRDIPTQFDVQQPFAPQVVALADACGLSPSEWQKTPILVNPPSLSAIAVASLAELHGRMGYFPPIIRLRPVSGALARYEVAEVINAQEVRDHARRSRS